MRTPCTWITCGLLAALLSLGGGVTVAQAQEATSTPDPHAQHQSTPTPSASPVATATADDTHAQHHPATTPAVPVAETPAATPGAVTPAGVDNAMPCMMDGEMAGMMQKHRQSMRDMMNMMDAMSGMEMPAAMRERMQQMRGMMDEMISGMPCAAMMDAAMDKGMMGGQPGSGMMDSGMMDSSMMQQHMQSMREMMGMMESMDGMEMPAAMRDRMQQMRGMMDGMMGDMMGQGMGNPSGAMPGMPTPSADTTPATDATMSELHSMMAEMDAMLAMEMPADLRIRMQAMRGRMDKMMTGMMGGQSMAPGASAENEHAQHHPDAAAPATPEATVEIDHSAHAAADPATTEAADHSAHGAGGHAMGPVSSEGVPPAAVTAGAQPLAYTLDGDVKVFTLTAQAVQWPILQGVTMTAWTYNGSVPGPLMRVTEGEKVRVVLTNALPEATTIHWHGVQVPFAMDGVPGMPHAAVAPGETFTYEFVARPAGSFMYHSHASGDVQVGLGLYAPLIIDPATPEEPAPDVDLVVMLSEARVVDGVTYPAMPMAGMEPNFFLLNGKAFPDTPTIDVKQGDRVRIRFMGIGQMVHPMHLHGMPFKVVATDGHSVPEAAQLTKDTILVAPGERYDVEFVASESGKWMLHCHILHHTTNDGAEPGGLMMIFNVE